MIELVLLIGFIVFVGFKLNECEKMKKDKNDEHRHHDKEGN